MKILQIVWHSRTGTAQQLTEALAVAACAAAPELTVISTPADQVSEPAMLSADGYIFACPENLGTMSGAMKEMVDRLYYPLLDSIAGRPCALMIAAGTDGTGAVRQWQRIITGWRLRLVADPIIAITGADTAEAILAPKVVAASDMERARELGSSFATGLALGIY